MSWLGRLFRSPSEPPKALHPNVPLKKFSGGIIGIADVISVLSNSDQTISRTEALSVPAVARGRNLLCSVSTLPLEVVRVSDNKVVDSPLLRQIDLDVPNVVTVAQTIEDLAFVGVAWWRITSTDFDNFPASARRLDPATVTLAPPGTRSPAPLPSGHDPREALVYVDGKPVPAREVIRFDSPNPAVLTVGARVIRRAILLDKAAKTFAETPSPGAVLKPKDNAEPLSKDEVVAYLQEYQASVRTRGALWAEDFDVDTAPGANPAELQLVQLANQASLEICNLFGVDPEDVGLNVTSRTYFNASDRRLSRVNDVLAPYMRAITDRLSMGDVTRRGYLVRFDLRDYLKADPSERASVQKMYLDMGVLSAEEIRAAEGLPPGLPPSPPETPAPADQAPDLVPAEETP